MSTDGVLLLRWSAHFYIDKVCATFPFTYQHNTGRYRNALLFKQNAKKIFDNFTIKQNAEKVSETKKEGRRRTTATSRPPDESIWCLILYNQQNAEKVPETKKEHRRRTTSTSRYSRWSIWCLIHVLLYFGLTVLQYSPQSPPASHCLCRFRWA